MLANKSLPLADANHSETSPAPDASRSYSDKVVSWNQNSRHYHMRTYTLSRNCQEFLEQNGAALKVQVFLETIWALVLGRHNDTDDVKFAGCSHHFTDNKSGAKPVSFLEADVSDDRRLIDVVNALYQSHLDTSQQQIDTEIKEKDFDVQTTGSFIKTVRGFDEISKDMNKQSFPLSTYISTGEDRLIVLSYDDSVSPSAAIFVLNHFVTAIANAQRILEDPEITLGSIDLVNTEEREMLLALGSAKSAVASTTNVAEMFEKQASSSPQKIALREHEGQSWTYEQLNRQANSIAHQAKIQPKRFYAICMDRSVYFIATILAILKAGSAYTIIDPEGARERNADIIAQTQSVLVFVDKQYASSFEQASIVQDLPGPSDQVVENPSISISLDDACYVQFTSGSTGRPKGALLSHRSASSGIMNFKLNGCQNWLLFYNPIFSAAQRTILAPLVHGATLCIASKTQLTTALSQVVNDMDIHSLGLTPTALSLLNPDHVPNLKQVTLVGEALPKKTMDLWCDRVSLRNTYGLSEVTQLNFGRVLTRSEDPTVIGIPTDTTEAYVLVPDTQDLAPVGVLGELCLAGPQVSTGYINRPEETEQRFIPNPFGSGSLYRTGDGARRTSRGSIQVSGRLDYQVKINGQRVEPKEIDQIILAMDEVQDCATVAITFQERKVLVGGVVLKDSSAWTSALSALREHVAQRLPAYMQPAFWHPLTQIPKSATGKVNLGELYNYFANLPPDELLRHSRGNTEHEDVTDPTEQRIQETWAHVLRIDTAMVGRNDAFTDLGGSSIEAISAIGALRDQGIATDLSLLLDRTPLKNLAELARKIDLDAMDADPFSLLSSQDRSYFKKQENVADAYYTTPLQAGLIAATLGGADHYMYQRYWDIKGTDTSKLRRAIERVIAVNPILRTTFTMHNGRLVQIVKKTIDLPWNETNKKIKSVASSKDFKKTELEHPFLRVNIVDSKIMVVGMHHALFDFWSHKFLYHDLAAAYQGEDLKPRPPFTRFLKYVQNLDEEQEASFWRGFLDGTSKSIINNDVQPKTVQVSKTLPLDLNARLRSIGITSGTAIYTAWALVLSQHTNSNDVAFGVTLSGRDVPIPGIENMDGPTLATVPLRARFCDESSLLEVAKDIQKNLLQVNKHAQRGMANALRDGGLSADTMDTLVNILIQEQSPQDIGKVLRPYGTRPFWKSEYTTLEAESGAELKLRLSTAMSERRADFVLGQVCTALELLMHEAEVVIKDLDLLGSKERAFLLSKPDFQSPEPQLLHARFEGKAAKSSDAVAICWEGVRDVSYAQLNVMANQIAHFLIGQGVKPKDKVPMMFDKSVELVASLLAILKCGAAYVPMDPSNPADRNAFIVEESAATVVFAHQAHAEFDKHHQANTVFFENVNFNKLSISRPKVKIGVHDLAYVIYTSGSTGKPKGVQVPHSAAATSVTSMLDVEGRHEGEWRTLQFANYVFDASVQDIFNTLSSGGTLCMASSDKLLSEMTALINKMNVQQIITTPTVAKLMNPDDVPTLRKLILGGEPLRSEVVEDWAPEREVLNVYGPTEASMTVSTKLVTGDDSPRIIGKPYPTVAAYILRPDDTRLVPWGAVGELVIGGAQVTKGYAKRPEMTKKAFINGVDFGFEKLYRTGDYARFLENGELECLGRKDGQVKIHGHRIELGEIEAAIGKTQIFHDTVVLVTSQGSKSQLVAFVDLNDSDDAGFREPHTESEDIQRVVAGLRGLTPYMIPKLFVPVGRFPKLVSRKVDRKALQAWLNELDPKVLQDYSSDGAAGTHEVVPVTTDNEAKMEKIWADLFGIDRETIGKYATFFALGGDSIGAINLVSMARSAGLKVNVAQVIAAKTLEELAASATVIDLDAEQELSNVQYETPPEVNAQIKAVGLDIVKDVDYCYPSPPGQAEFLNWGAHNDQLWVLQTVRKISENYSMEAWKEASEELVRLNDILRTSWTRNDKGDWVGVVLKDHSIKLPENTYTSAEERDELIDNFWGENFVFGEPFIRFALFTGPAGEREIAVKLDHGMYDGTLFRIFDDQFSQIQKGHHVPPHPQYRDFARYMWLANKEPALNFWRNTLSSPPAVFRQDVAEPTITKIVSETTDVSLDDICSASNVTPSIIFQAAFQLWFARTTEGSKQGDVAFDYLLSGRNVDMENPQLINGNLANFLPFRTGAFEEETPISKYLQSTQDFFWAATEHGTVGLDEIYSTAGLDRKTHGNRVMFLFQPFDPPNGSRKEEMRWVVVGQSQVKMIQPYALVVEASKTVSGHRIKVMYDEKLYSEEQARGFTKAIVETAEAIATGSSDVAISTYL